MRSCVPIMKYHLPVLIRLVLAHLQAHQVGLLPRLFLPDISQCLETLPADELISSVNIMGQFLLSEDNRYNSLSQSPHLVPYI